ncbi:hypothetical protein [Succinivibrio dextrinosolvens]|uniref:Uncharacterized protein n=1 Tax=Succinivibrio dextrinosolvens TaxID=83771 RepID=A0A662Z6W8_9GAMM|nr:hypothetical protein [Succinivibrio dextrinosolvens]SFJ84973.1 hypothetical protein SAMN04487865_100473 [Succinivibrio dextrinosolvens]
MDFDTYRYYNFEVTYEENGRQHTEHYRIRAHGKPEATKLAKEKADGGWFSSREKIKVKYLNYEDDFSGVE